MIGFDTIKETLPQGYPFLFVDRVLEVEAGKRIRCLKNVTGNEYFFPGHFPAVALMPGTIIVEALAQCALLLFRDDFSKQGERVFLLGSAEARFLKPVVPGDQLIMEVEAEKVISSAAIVRAVAQVDDRPAVKAKLTFAAVERGTLPA